ncbi:Hypothetical protein A7982_05537 [Minicystis rosea]|nr:Hypothetical protein A7982_05537 [Minicystis rosea]
MNLFGLDPNGDIDDNDKLYVGLHCTAEAPAGGPETGTCPEGQFVVGTLAGGGVQCESPAALVQAFFGAHCRVYLGWQDKCSGCSTPPIKWGHAGEGTCVNGIGVDDTCTTPTLSGQTVSLFGLNTDGDVDDNDQLYLGFQCF